MDIKKEKIRQLIKVEADAIVNKVVQLCKDEKYKEKNLGIISLQGKAQSSLIEEILLKTLGQNEISKRGIICGDPSQFQGDERDIILLSMVVANNDNFRALTKIDEEQRFNRPIAKRL